jgi:enamine deaminase RidA (YjgF/YER057c/UK114 family)
MKLCITTALACAMVAMPATADGIVRRQTGDFPIASSVEVPAGSTLVFVSGQLADPVKPDAPPGSSERYGDTATQVVSVLGKIRAELEKAGLGLGDVVKMNVFLVGDPAQGGSMDFVGLMRAYSTAFGTASGGRLPARTTVQVAALPLPGALVEIEVVAARAP